ncbi:MAG TPA: hypothetical protein VJY35_10215 [Candidatus Eisenbacteria bacterium]|nr:hypothetical protein [Candidatus Eisenbacteria bacterium]
MKTRFVLLLALALLGSLSCAQGPSRIFAPRGLPPERIEFALTASAAAGSPAEPVTITATLENLGRSVQLPCHYVPLIRIYDNQGNEIYIWNPTIVVIGTCDPNFRSNQRYVQPLTFDGNSYSSDGQPRLAPAGTYRAIAEFQYFGESGLQTLTREVTFTWH